MVSLSLPTLLISLGMADDYELRNYAKSELSRMFSAEAVGVIRDFIKDGIRKLDKDEEAAFISDMEAKGNIPAFNCYPLIDAFAKAAERRTDTPLPIGSIMEMYHSDDDFLIKKSKEYVIRGYEMFVNKVMHTYYPQFATSNMEELQQCGAIGLLKAMKGYDAGSGEFTTYSFSFVRHEISKQVNFLKHSPSVHYNNMQKKIKDAEASLINDGYEATVMQISLLTGLKPEVVMREKECLERARYIYLDDSENTKEYTCCYDDTPEAICEKHEKSRTLVECIDSLPPDVRTVFLMKIDHRTNEEIANRLGATVGQIKTKCQQATNMLRKDLRIRGVYKANLSKAEYGMLRYDAAMKKSKKTAEEQLEEAMECVCGDPMLQPAGAPDPFVFNFS